MGNNPRIRNFKVSVAEDDKNIEFGFPRFSSKFDSFRIIKLHRMGSKPRIMYFKVSASENDKHDEFSEFEFVGCF